MRARSLLASLMVAGTLTAWTAPSIAQLPPGSKIGAVTRDADGTIRIDQTAAPPAAAINAAKSDRQAGSAAPRPTPKAKPAPPKTGGARLPPAAAIATLPISSADADERAEPERLCPEAALGCVWFRGAAANQTAPAPVTFGQLFRPGALKAGAAISMVDEAGKRVPVQLDAKARYADGSIRHAIVSLMLPSIAPGHEIRFELRKGETTGELARNLEPRKAGTPPVAVEFSVYQPKVTLIEFEIDGNPEHVLKAGETVTLRLGNAPGDAYSVPVAPQLAGPNGRAKLIEALDEAINRGGRFRAEKIEQRLLMVWPVGGPEQHYEARIDYGGAQPIKLTMPVEPEARETYRFAGADGTQDQSPWLDGPIVEETRVYGAPRAASNGAPHPLIRVMLDTRHYRDATRVAVTVENTQALIPWRNVYYDVTVRVGDRVLLSEKAVQHYGWARWHRDYWLEPVAEPEIIQDRAMLWTSGVMPIWAGPQYAGGIVDEVTRALAARRDRGVMAGGIITTYFGMTGERWDIGPAPQWVAAYLMTADPRARAAMIEIARIGATIPVHFSGDVPGRPISLLAHPGFALVLPTEGPRKPAGFMASPWQPDRAHQPALAYIPYLVTGERDLLEELQYWANYNLIEDNPDYRTPKLLLVDYAQVRAMAWGLRTLGDAAALTPDDHPFKSELQTVLDNNLGFMVEKFVENRHGPISPLGLIGIGYGSSPTETKPWQQDFFTYAIAHLAELGYAKARVLLPWRAKATASRIVAAASLSCPFALNGWDVPKRVAEGGPYVQSFAEMEQIFLAKGRGCPKDWAANPIAARGAAAMLAPYREIPDVAEAYQISEDRLGRSPFSGALGPKWAFIPRKAPLNLPEWP